MQFPHGESLPRGEDDKVTTPEEGLLTPWEPSLSMSVYLW